MDPKLQQPFRLGKCVVHPLEGRIDRPDGSSHVRPKVMEALLCFAARPGDIVSREEIAACAWGDQPVSDETLTHCISELRHALGDSPTHPTCIQTVPKRGYRLVTEVEEIGATSQSKTKTPSSQGGFLARQFSDLRQRKVFQSILGYPVLAWLLVQIVDVLWEYLLLPLGAPAWIVPAFVVLLALGYPIAVFMAWAVDLTPDGPKITLPGDKHANLGGLVISGLAVLVIAAGALSIYFNAYDPPPPKPDETEIATTTPVAKSIAVLRFLNISDNPAIDYLCDGLTEELIHELTNLRTLKVAARTSVWPFLNTQLKAPEIAEQIGVEKVLEGSIRADGDQIRVTAQLIDETGFHLWSETYDRSMDDILEIQKDIAGKVVDELDVILNDEAKARLASVPTESNNAYDLYLKGRQALRGPVSPDSILRAESYFERAIQVDYQFSLAHAGLCEAHLASYRSTGNTTHFEKAEIACHRALTLDGGLAEIYTALGNLYRLSGQPDKAEQEFLMALGINPMLEEANYGLGRTYQAQGRLAEAEETLRRSIDMEPGYWGTYFGYANFLHRQGRFSETVPFYERVTQMEPEFVGGFNNLGSTLHWLGDWDGAEDAFRRALELEPNQVAFQNLGTVFFYQHHFAEAAQMFETAADVAPAEHRAWGWLGAALRFVPESEVASQVAYQKAIELVEKQLSVNPNEPEDLARLGVYLAHSGKLDEAREALARSMELAPGDPTTQYFEAILELSSGNDELALEKLAKAVQLGYSLEMLNADPTFAALQERSARFRALLGNN